MIILFKIKSFVQNKLIAEYTSEAIIHGNNVLLLALTMKSK